MRIFSVLFLTVLLIYSQEVLGQVKRSRLKPRNGSRPMMLFASKTELVQTAITVVDKRGRFAAGLSAGDFELRVDSKLQPLSFFEEVAAGSVEEEKQLTAARKGDIAALAKLPGTSASESDRGRVIFFCG